MEETKTKPNILYVDDEQDNLFVFKSAFRRDYNVFTALSGQEGLEIIKKENISVIITDQRMPYMTGIQFLQQLPESILSIRMIMTGYSDVEAVIEAINTGRVYRYITKPWEKDELKVTIDNAIEALELRKKNHQLIIDLQEANETLEQKVIDRTAEVNRQKEEIERKNKNITDSIHYAKRIQEAILPPKNFVTSHLPENFILYKPKDIVSGDFYWMEKSDDNKILLAAVDCTGHGVPGAFVSIIGHLGLKRALREFKLTQPAKILDKLNEIVEETFRQSGTGDIKDGMDISLCSLSFSPGGIELEFSGGNNPLWIARKGGSAIEEIRADKQPIGAYIRRVPFSNQTVSLQHGDSFYLFSDGYADQFGGPKRKKFLSSRLKELILSFQGDSMETQYEILLETIEKWRGSLEQIDDICIIGVRV